MGKNIVLKDDMNRLAGYVRLHQGKVFCRIYAGSPAKLMLLFENGMQQTAELDGGSTEQCFPCKGDTLCGCCVFKEERILCVSHERMRSIFMRRISPAGKLEGRKDEKTICSEKKQPTVQEETRSEALAQQPDFAQRRWPPPPCMSHARYLQGKWLEE